MIRAGLTPYAEAQHACKIWLDQYFERQGDEDPDSSFVAIQIQLKKHLYEKYSDEFKRTNREVVDESLFNKIWNVIYPYHRIRPYCDIPGHCSTCYEIDRGRRLATTKSAERRYTEAHFMHRAGLFMLEREGYV